MKNIAIMFSVIGLILFGYGLGTKIESVKAESETGNSNIYADCGLIMDEPTEIVQVTFQNGNVFAIENTDGDWILGDLMTIIFDDNGTMEIYDDTIISYKYSGWISKSEIENWIKGNK